MVAVALSRKWRPSCFSEVVGQDHVTKVLDNALRKKTGHHHAYLFVGRHGTGKTTIARILARCFNCENGPTNIPCNKCNNCLEIINGVSPNVQEIDAASRTGVDDVRDLIESAKFSPVGSKYKIYIMDEMHMLSKSGFNALLKILEEPDAFVKFIFATTEPKKLPLTVVSRCLQFNLKRLTNDQIVVHMKKILQIENVVCENDALYLIARAADGSMRDALSILEQAILFCSDRRGSNGITTASVKEMLGVVDTNYVVRILESLIARNLTLIMGVVNELHTLSKDFISIVDELMELFHRISILQIYRGYGEERSRGAALNRIESSNDSEDLWKSDFGKRMFSDYYDTELFNKLESIASSINPEDLQLYYQTCLIGKRDMNFAPSLRVGFEMIMLRMLVFTPIIFGGVRRQQHEAGLDTSKNLTVAREVRSTSEVKKIIPLAVARDYDDADDGRDGESGEGGECGGVQISSASINNLVDQLKNDNKSFKENKSSKEFGVSADINIDEVLAAIIKKFDAKIMDDQEKKWS